MQMDARWWSAALLSIAVAGCRGDKVKIATYPVVGEVLYGGKPAAGVRVFLQSEASSPPDLPMNPHGVTGPDGRFALSTYEKDDGAPEGKYQVILHWPTEARESQIDRLRGMYGRGRSLLSVSIKAADNVLPPIRLTAAGAAEPQ